MSNSLITASSQKPWFKLNYYAYLERDKKQHSAWNLILYACWQLLWLFFAFFFASFPYVILVIFNRDLNNAELSDFWLYTTILFTFGIKAFFLFKNLEEEKRLFSHAYKILCSAIVLSIFAIYYSVAPSEQEVENRNQIAEQKNIKRIETETKAREQYIRRCIVADFGFRKVITGPDAGKWKNPQTGNIWTGRLFNIDGEADPQGVYDEFGKEIENQELLCDLRKKISTIDKVKSMFR